MLVEYRFDILYRLGAIVLRTLNIQNSTVALATKREQVEGKRENTDAQALGDSSSRKPLA